MSTLFNSLMTCMTLVRERCSCGAPQPKRGLARQLLAALCVFPLLTGCVVAVLVFEVHRHRDAPRVEGHVVRSFLLEDERGRFFARLFVGFTFEGQDYERAIDLGFPRRRSEPAQADLDEHPVGSRVRLMIDPQDPTQPQLDGPFPAVYLGFPLFLLAGFTILGDWMAQAVLANVGHALEAHRTRFLAPPNLDTRASLVQPRLLGPRGTTSKDFTMFLALEGALFAGWVVPALVVLAGWVGFTSIFVWRSCRELRLFSRWRGVTLLLDRTRPFEARGCYQVTLQGPRGVDWGGLEARLQYRSERFRDGVWKGHAEVDVPVDLEPNGAEAATLLTLPTEVEPSMAEEGWRKRWVLWIQDGPDPVAFDLWLPTLGRT